MSDRASSFLHQDEDGLLGQIGDPPPLAPRIFHPDLPDFRQFPHLLGRVQRERSVLRPSYQLPVGHGEHVRIILHVVSVQGLLSFFAIKNLAFGDDGALLERITIFAREHDENPSHDRYDWFRSPVFIPLLSLSLVRSVIGG